ncbi:arsenate reductase (glutaredoxin) [Frateuria aurantia]
MADTLRIYHNPRCSKSRGLLQHLHEQGLSPEVRLYLEQPPTIEELQALLAKLGLPARELLRRDESQYRELGLDDPSLGEMALIQAMVDNPRLIQRPILECIDMAVIGRPLAAADAMLARQSR